MSDPLDSTSSNSDARSPKRASVSTAPHSPASMASTDDLYSDLGMSKPEDSNPAPKATPASETSALLEKKTAQGLPETGPVLSLFADSRVSTGSEVETSEVERSSQAPATLPIFDRATLSPIISFDSYPPGQPTGSGSDACESDAEHLPATEVEIADSLPEQAAPFVPTDEWIASTIRDRLASRLQQASRLVIFEVDGGHVIMKGSVGSYYFKQLVQEAALRVAGVQSVVNQVQVTADHDLC